MITTKNLKKKYPGFELKNINLEIKKGELFGCIGKNGSGKSTLVKSLTGQITADSGEINILGTNPIKDPIKTKEKIGIIPEQESPPSFLTVKEYLRFICEVRKIKNYEKEINKWLDFLEYKQEENNLIKDLSRGTKQKVVATQAFIHNPKVVFIDEPLINLDPLIQKKFKEFLTDYVKKENTIFLSTHVLSIAQEICTKIGIINNGEIIYQEDVSKIKKQKKDLETFFIEIINKNK